METGWDKKLRMELDKAKGSTEGRALWEKYCLAFSDTYKKRLSPSEAQADIEIIEKLGSENPVSVCFYQSKTAQDRVYHLRLYSWKDPLPLSDTLPMLENLGVTTFHDNPQKIADSLPAPVWINDFTLGYEQDLIGFDEVKPLFEEAFLSILQKTSENDGLNKLVLSASLSSQEIMVLRAYTKYLRQIRFRFTPSYIEEALNKHPLLTSQLITFFYSMHDPKIALGVSESHSIEQLFLASLSDVNSLDEDIIIRRFYHLIKATVRTNFFQQASHECLCLKFDSRRIPDMPYPVPLYETFVYSPFFEAIHLRNAKVSRGGIRWSDRPEDFRTEILGLMNTQIVKNSVIVPSGAKGGFVINPSLKNSKDLPQEGLKCYKRFISSLLDITDNQTANKIIKPRDVVCYDDDDSYLVVAADKGTAKFSDIANAIAIDRGFWLKDAFASGGETGYDHKKFGITARGAWESVRRHFLALNIDTEKECITVAGIGDMGGDVFGNGMIYSKKIKLLAAFDHRDIFLDPNPDPETSFQERLRLFHLSKSSWQDYNPLLLSEGGGVFSRGLKSITLTQEVKQALDIAEDTLTPDELIQAILKAPVDLLYNGGVGTFVKSEKESHAAVSDKVNDYCRVNGKDLRCKVAVEGGNLGFTQRGRVEYALTGGLINADFIDNSGGVDCSDHEVNLKILLELEGQKRTMPLEKRNKIIKECAKEVCSLVLKNNYDQAFIIDYMNHSSVQKVDEHIEYFQNVLQSELFSSRAQSLPTLKAIKERASAKKGLTKPEFAELIALTKIYIKTALMQSEHLQHPFLREKALHAFPKKIRDHYKQSAIDHPLSTHINATLLANWIVNQMGMTFVYHAQLETGASIADIVLAYEVAFSLFQAKTLIDDIEKSSGKSVVTLQYDMHSYVQELLSLATHWLLYSRYLKQDLTHVLDTFSTKIQQLENVLPKIMSGQTKRWLDEALERLAILGLPKKTIMRIATCQVIYTALNIIDLHLTHDLDLLTTAKVYFAIGEKTGLSWFRDQIAKDHRIGFWNRLAKASIRDELDLLQRRLTLNIMTSQATPKNYLQWIDSWIEKNYKAFSRWDQLLADLKKSEVVEYDKLFITIRELFKSISWLV